MNPITSREFNMANKMHLKRAVNKKTKKIKRTKGEKVERNAKKKRIKGKES